MTLPAIYLCDQGTGIYRIENGAITHVFASPDSIPCSFVTHNGAGQVVALGQPTTGSGGTFAQAFGFLLNGDDLSVINAFWGPDAGSNTGQWVDVDDPPRVHTNFNVTFDGTGAAYDSTQDEVLVITEMRGYPDNVSSQDTDDMVSHLSPAGVFLRADKDISASSPSTPLSSVQGKGVCVLGTKLYFDFGNASLCEYDVVTGATRSAYQCFTAMDDGGRNCGIKADSVTGRLWRMPSGGSSDGITNLQAFDPEDIPWGTTGGTPPTILDTVKIADDNTGGWGYFQGFSGSSFDWAGDRAVVAVREWDSGDLAIISVARDGSSTSPDLVYQDSGNLIDGGIAWDMMVFPVAAPVPNIRSSTHPARLRWM